MEGASCGEMDGGWRSGAWQFTVAWRDVSPATAQHTANDVNSSLSNELASFYFSIPLLYYTRHF